MDLNSHPQNLLFLGLGKHNLKIHFEWFNNAAIMRHDEVGTDSSLLYWFIEKMWIVLEAYGLHLKNCSKVHACIHIGILPLWIRSYVMQWDAMFSFSSVVSYEHLSQKSLLLVIGGYCFKPPVAIFTPFTWSQGKESKRVTLAFKKYRFKFSS